jgi:molybdopterin converting factor subunit 1
MQITVLLFASYADTLGASSIALELHPGATAGDALDQVRLLANGGALPNRPMLAVNERYARREHVLASGDEVAIIPPVAGG